MKEYLIEKTRLDSETFEKYLYLVFYSLFVYHNISQIRWLCLLEKNNWDLDKSEKEFFSLYKDYEDPLDLRLCLEEVDNSCWNLVNDLATDPFLNTVRIQENLNTNFNNLGIERYELEVI